MTEIIGYLRDVDGTGSLHPCSKGDAGAIPVCDASMAADRIEELMGIIRDIWSESSNRSWLGARYGMRIKAALEQRESK